MPLRLERPSWYGVPILTAAGFRRVGVALLVLCPVSAILAAFLLGLSTREVLSSGEQLLRLAAMIYAFPVFLVAWFCAVFFWFRGVVNTFKMNSRARDGYFGRYGERLWNPLYGWRNRDLDAVGVAYRRLAIEGYLGFLLACSAALAAGAASKFAAN